MPSQPSMPSGAREFLSQHKVEAVPLALVMADDNAATSGGGVGIVSGGQPAVDLIDSIFQNPQGGNNFGASSAFDSLGHNLFSNDPAITIASTDLVNADALLGPLANYRGPTFTQAPLARQPRDQRRDLGYRRHNRSARGRSAERPPQDTRILTWDC